MRCIIGILLIALHINCFAQSAANLTEGTVDRGLPHQIVIRGVIGPSTAARFRQLLDGETREVVVTSEGGLTMTALEIAELMQARSLSVVVKDYCLSSCANYLFVGGVSRRVEPNSVVAWHGGHTTNIPKSPLANSAACDAHAALARREQLLYLRARVSLDLIVYSGYLTMGSPTGEEMKVNAFGIQSVIARAEREYHNWAPTPAELLRLGIVEAMQFWHPGSAAEAERVLESHGFKDTKVSTDRAYSYIPRFLRSPALAER